VSHVKKKLLAALLVIAFAGLLALTATTASATMTRSTRCTNCHTGADIPVTATLLSTSATGATYSVSAPGASGIAVFNGTVRVGSNIPGSSGEFTVAFGATYTIYGVGGPGEADGIGSTTVSPVAPTPSDTTAPTTTSNATASYVSAASITLTPADNAGGSGVAATYYTIDGGTQASGTTIDVSGVGPHTIEFWSVDVAGNIEGRSSASFTITAPPVLDTTAPVTTSDAGSTYVSAATILLTATDNAGGSGVAATYYTIDGGTQASGTTIDVSGVGSHTITFWSVDAAGNVESATTATFEITAPAPEPTTSITIKSSSASVRQEHSVRLSGVLSPAKHDVKVSLYVQRPGSSRWTLVSRVSVGSHGSWKASYAPHDHGDYRFQVRFTSGGVTIVSDTITVTSVASSRERSDD
jgi:hypothetical protein